MNWRAHLAATAVAVAFAAAIFFNSIQPLFAFQNVSVHTVPFAMGSYKIFENNGN